MADNAHAASGKTYKCIGCAGLHAAPTVSGAVIRTTGYCVLCHADGTAPTMREPPRESVDATPSSPSPATRLCLESDGTSAGTRIRTDDGATVSGVTAIKFQAATGEPATLWLTLRLP